MEKERIYRENISRVIQNKSMEAVGIVDNRSNTNYLNAAPVQRVSEEDEETIQGKLSAPIQRNETGMPDNLKAGIENLSGFSMDDVRVHYNSSKPATVQALAYTQGIDIHIAPGQEKHLPHEAWHVAQQMAGRVSPTTNINGMPVNDNAELEHEADVMGEKAVQRKAISSNIQSSVICNSKTIQCGRANDIMPLATANHAIIIKINFAGSSYPSWGKQAKGTSCGQVSGHDILVKTKDNGLVYEYSFPGPMSAGGMLNGSPSIDQLVNSATSVITPLLSVSRAHLIIKGHSRGAVAAGELYRVFVNNPNIIECNLTMLDPVPGPDAYSMYPQTDLNLSATGAPIAPGANTGKVVFFSLGIAHQNAFYRQFFTPQIVQNANVYIFTNDGHSCYVDTANNPTVQNKKDRYDFQGTIYTYSQLSTLPSGYYQEVRGYIHHTLNVPVHGLINITRPQALALVSNTPNLSHERDTNITSSL
ncbi:MAG: DUF4157 domain-containing protein [Bacteroidaceae bacterium]|nr:DUF4157 domain-containing protein [Bacteroidaceae bacterium]